MNRMIPVEGLKKCTTEKKLTRRVENFMLENDILPIRFTKIRKRFIIEGAIFYDNSLDKEYETDTMAIKREMKKNKPVYIPWRYKIDMTKYVKEYKDKKKRYDMAEDIAIKQYQKEKEELEVKERMKNIWLR